MKKVRRILVPVDFSACSMAATRAALTLAQGLKAEVVLLHIPELPGAVEPDALIHPEPGAPEIPLTEFFRQRAEVEFVPYREVLGATLTDTRVVPARRPEEVIISVADDLDADMIVMGTHGRRGLQRWLMGSVTERVLRETARPVLVIRGGETQEVSGSVTSGV